MTEHVARLLVWSTHTPALGPGPPNAHNLPQLAPAYSLPVQVVSRIESLEAQLSRNAVFRAEKDQAKFAPFLRRAALAARADAIRDAMRTSQLARFREEAAQRTAVLRRLGHIDEEGAWRVAGRGGQAWSEDGGTAGVMETRCRLAISMLGAAGE